MVEARQAGKLRVIGFTGHKDPHIHLHMLEVADAHGCTFRPLSEPEVAALLSKTATAAAGGRFEPFKVSSIFDATAEHPEWLGEEQERLQALMP